MIATVLIIISLLIGIGIIFIIYSIKTAKIDEGQLDQEFDEKAFAKPSGWKVGKMPSELEQTEKPEINELNFSRENSSIEDDFSRFPSENFYRTKESN